MVNTTGALRKCPSKNDCAVIAYLDPKTKVDILGSYNNEEWYQVAINSKSALSGWMHSSILDKIIGKDKVVESQQTTQGNDQKTLEVKITQEKPQKGIPWYKKVSKFFTNLFK